MPLIKSKSKKAFSRNVETEMNAGKPQKQALAIAYDMKRRAPKKKMADGGFLDSIKSAFSTPSMDMGAHARNLAADKPRPANADPSRPAGEQFSTPISNAEGGEIKMKPRMQFKSNPRMTPTKAFKTRLLDKHGNPIEDDTDPKALMPGDGDDMERSPSKEDIMEDHWHERPKFAEGGGVKGVHSPAYGDSSSGQSKAGINSNTYQSTSSNTSKIAAKREHKKVLEEMRSMPNPKLEGLAKGGMAYDKNLKGINQESGMQGISEAGVHARKLTGQSMQTEWEKDAHKKTLKEMQEMPNPKLKGLAEGGQLGKKGPMDSLAGGAGHNKYQDQSEKQKGINRPHAAHSALSHSDVGTSEAGDYVKDTYGGRPTFEGASHPAKKEHKKVLEEMRSMPNPKLEGLAEGGTVHREFDLQPEPEAEEELHDSIAAAIMSKRKKMAEGGEAILKENYTEQPNGFYPENEHEALDWEAADVPMPDHPEDSNEKGDDIDSDDHDMVSAIRRKMKSRKQF